MKINQLTFSMTIPDGMPDQMVVEVSATVEGRDQPLRKARTVAVPQCDALSRLDRLFFEARNKVHDVLVAAQSEIKMPMKGEG